jgi:pSer/pThr/pTyr-binding forkhead associated (FHA) protein
MSPQQEAVHAVLVWFGLDNRKHFYYFTSTRTKCAIGRHNAALDIDMSKYTDVKTVSHKHATIQYRIAKDETWSWQLLSYGRNGTRINNVLHGKRLPTAATDEPGAIVALNSGDYIEIGKVNFRIWIYNPNGSAYLFDVDD